MLRHVLKMIDNFSANLSKYALYKLNVGTWREAKPQSLNILDCCVIHHQIIVSDIQQTPGVHSDSKVVENAILNCVVRLIPEEVSFENLPKSNILTKLDVLCEGIQITIHIPFPEFVFYERHASFAENDVRIPMA
jgi:hypothetical protein